MGEWGGLEVCASQGVWRWVLRNTVGTERVRHYLKSPAVSLGDGCVHGGTAGLVQVHWLVWDLLDLVTPLWIPHFSLRVPLQGHLHDRYGQLVSIYTRLLLTKISFHVKVRPFATSSPLEQGDVPCQQEY